MFEQRVSVSTDVELATQCFGRLQSILPHFPGHFTSMDLPVRYVCADVFCVMRTGGWKDAMFVYKAMKSAGHSLAAPVFDIMTLVSTLRLCVQLSHVCEVCM